MGLLDRIRSRLAPAPAATPRAASRAQQTIDGANGRLPAAVYGDVSKSNPYKGQVAAVDFPIVTLPRNKNIPPSVNPQPGRPRRGSTPNPTGYTAPGGAFTGRSR